METPDNGNPEKSSEAEVKPADTETVQKLLSANSDDDRETDFSEEEEDEDMSCLPFDSYLEEEEEEDEMRGAGLPVDKDEVIVVNSDDGSEGIALALDRHNRPEGVSSVPCLDQPSGFTAWNISLPETAVKNLIEHCQDTAARPATGQYSPGDTYWIAAGETAKNNYEALALEIFRKHTVGVEFDKERSGAEWWTVVIDSESSEVGLHWDRDYNLEEDTDIQVHPHVATVLYLTDGGVPTCVFPVVSTMTCTDDIEPMASCPPRISFPKVMKHITFDGRLLHGALTPLAREPSTKRISFLVNIWLNWIPTSAARFEGNLALDDWGELTWTACPPALDVDCSGGAGTMTREFTTNKSRYRLEGAFPDPKSWSDSVDNYSLLDPEQRWKFSGPYALKRRKGNDAAVVDEK